MRHALLIAPLLVLLFGCDDLSSYRTGSGEVFRGGVVGSEMTSFIRRGFPVGTTLDLTFDPARAASITPGPGSISTSDGTFADTALEPITPLAHDTLSDYDFPGSGRVRNYIFIARPSAGPAAGRSAMVFLSLLQDGKIEVRLILGSGENAGDYFGVFRLERGPR